MRIILSTHIIFLRRLFSYLCFILIFASTLAGCAATGDSYNGRTSEGDNADFEKFTSELFCNELAGNTLSLHYTVENPSDYQIKDYDITLGNLSNEYRKTSKSCLSDYKKTLLAFSNEALSREEQLTYEILCDYLDTQIALSDYDLYQEILLPNNGIESQLPILYAEYSFHTEQDVKDYLALISTTDTYFSQIIDFEKEKVKEGLFMSDAQCDSVLSACEDFLADQNDNLLFSTFESRLAGVPDLSEEQVAAYIEQNHTAVMEHVFTAYENLIRELTLMMGCGKNDWGLCYYKDGKDYYSLLVRAGTGCSLSMEEIDELIASERDMDLSVCASLVSDNPELLAECSDFSWNYADENAMLSQLQSEMQTQFPAPSDIPYTISYVEESLQDSLAPAFYITAPIDNYENNRIYINSARSYPNISYFTTLAHESFPGHLYQTVMTYTYDFPSVRAILDYPGYTEGWATYVEMLSYYYAGLESDMAKLLQHNQSASLSLYATSDIGIHYYGWKEDELYNFWAQYGVTDTGTVDEIAQLIISEPGNYLKYYVGYLQFEQLRAYAEEHFGDDYSPVMFHKALLDIGPAPFDIIKNYLDSFYYG